MINRTGKNFREKEKKKKNGYSFKKKLLHEFNQKIILSDK